MLLQMARRDQSDAGRERLARLAPRVDWPRLREWAQSGGVVGFAARHIEGLEAPAAIKKQLVVASLQNQLRNGVLMDEARGLCALAEERGLLLIPLKGAALNMGLPYDDLSLRSMSDLDLLTSRDQVESLTSLLMERGYEPCGGARGMRTSLRYSYHFMFEREVRGLHVHLELHWTAMRLLYCRPEEDDQVIQRAALRPWGDALVRVLHPEDQLLAVILHFAEHRFRCQLKWLVDVAELCRAHEGELDWPRLAARVRAMGAERVCGHALELAAVYLDAPAPGGFSVPLRPLLARLNPIEALVEARPYPPVAARALSDLLLFDAPVDGLAFLFHRGSELLDRHLGLTVPRLFARRNLLRRS